jgi:hypothetical protein
MADDLRHDFAPRACGHALLHEIARLQGINQAIAEMGREINQKIANHTTPKSPLRSKFSRNGIATPFFQRKAFRGCQTLRNLVLLFSADMLAISCHSKSIDSTHSSG